MKKKLRKVKEFWSEIGAGCGHSGSEVEKLFKNLQPEYQKIKQQLHISGIDTTFRPMLRHSYELFVAYDEYYSLFFPQGGSAVPGVIMTESTTFV